MAITEKLIVQEAAAAGGDADPNIMLDLNAGDVDSYDGDGDVWYDIHDFEFTPTTNVSEHFNTVTYTGNSLTNSITGVGFQPDLVWLKQRNSAQNHGLFDSVRGENNFLSSNLANDAETRTTDTLSSFDADGFTLTGYTSDAFINYTGRTMVAWCFKAGGAPSGSDKVSIDGTSYATMTDAGLTEGTVSINKLSLNTELGFSIATYNGNNSTGSVAHGLGQKPEMIIIKSTGSNGAWIVYSDTIGATKYLALNSTNAATSASNRFNNTEPNSNVWTFGTSDNVHTSNEHIVYSFASKRGVSKVGSYLGDGSTNNKIYTGFEPAFVMLKNTSTSNTRWIIMDNARNPDNPATKVLSPNLNNAEDTSSSYWLLDWERDGFRLKYGADNEFNQNGATFIYYAVAKDTNAGSLIPSTDGEEIETDLMFDPTLVNYYGTYAFEQDNTVWKGNSSKSNGHNEGEVYANNYFESGDTGKYYFEVKCLDSSGHGGLGFTDPTKYTGGNGGSQNSFRNGQLWGLSSNAIQTGGFASNTTFANSTNTTDEVTAIAIDVATRKVWMGRVLSGSITWYNSGDPSGGTNPLLTLPSNYNIYQPLVYDGSWSGSSARYAFWKIHREAEASSLPTGFSYMKGAIKNSDLELHLDASTYSSGSTWTDSSGNGNDGTITGATHNDELGDFFEFNGSSDKVTLPSSFTTAIDQSTKTFEMWFNSGTSSSTGYGMIFSHDGSGLSYGRFFAQITYSTKALDIIVGSQQYLATTIEFNKWYHFTISFNGSTYEGFLNGESIGTATNNNFSGSATAATKIGTLYNDNYYYNGKIGQVRAYTTALSQAQIRQNYNFTKPKYPNEFHGDINGATWNASGYFDFDGSNDYIDLDTSIGSTFWANNWSASSWVYFDSTSSANQAIFTSHGLAYNYLMTNNNTQLRYSNDNGVDFSTSSGVVSAGQWHHIVITRSSVDGTVIYVDKVSVGTNSSSSNAATSNASGAKPQIGAYTSTGSYPNFYLLDGRVSKFKLYNKALTQAEVDALYNEGE